MESKFDWKEWKRMPETEYCISQLKENMMYMLHDLKLGGKEKFDNLSGRIDGYQEAVNLISEIGEEE